MGTEVPELVRRINESVRHFYTVVIIAVGLALALSFFGSLLANRLSDVGWARGWYVLTCVFLSVVLLLYLLWRFLAPQTSHRKNASLRLIFNSKQNEVLWSPSWTYLAGAAAHQVYEVLEKRGLLSQLKLEGQGDRSGIAWIEDLPGYLVLRWLSGFGLTARPAGMRLKPVALSDLPASMSQNNRLVRLISKMGPPSGFIEAAVSRLTIELPESFSISTPAGQQGTAGVVNLSGIVISNRYCRAEILTGPMLPSNRPPVARRAPAPSIDGMPINAAPPEYYLEQLPDTMVVSWPMVLTVGYSASMLLFRPRKAQRRIEYLSEMADMFVEYFSWDSALARARAWEKDRTYDVLMDIQSDVTHIRQKVDHQNE